ncbi:chemotaxis protein CheW [Pseudoflavonifractor sp. 524-17]|uniref:chemotaxis protein CheW n=1 Tax=Pseudoflavonifractor sp. 524-17 TaxID=2304577 RepID=UPI00192A1FA9|nr:chemotaxis protein CheW [Pseudoflavonifractor sp. 524-17]
MNEEILFAKEDELDALSAAPAEEIVDSKKYLIFLTDDLKMGVDAECVVEIINNLTITYLPMLPEYIRGIINLRGQMVPILDIRLRLGKESTDDSLVIVLNLEETYLGILVDAVDQMIDIPKSNILPMPSHSVQLLVSGMCSLPDGSGTMMVLDCEQLMPHD